MPAQSVAGSTAIAELAERSIFKKLVNEVLRLLPNSARSCSVITLAEVTAVLNRKRNDGRIPRSLYKEALLEFNREFIDDEDVFISSVDDDLVLESIPLIEIHHINTTDALLP